MFSLGNGYTKMKSWISLEKCMLIKAKIALNIQILESHNAVRYSKVRPPNEAN